MDEEEVPEPSLDVEPELSPEEAAIPEMLIGEVAARLDQPNFHVYDTNSPARWKRNRVRGARNVDGYSFDRSVLPEDTKATLVFYCTGPGCHSCHAGAAHARTLGYHDVYVMPEGIDAYVKAKHPIDAG